MKAALAFWPKARQLAVALFILSFATLVFYDADRPPVLNVFVLGLPMLLQWAVVAGLWKRWNIARWGVYVLFVLTVAALLLFYRFTDSQKIVYVMALAYYLYAILLFFRRKPDVLTYFEAKPLTSGWKIAWGTLAGLYLFAVLGVFFFQTSLRRMSNTIASNMESELVLEGDVNPSVMNTCMERYAAANLTGEKLEKFCRCVALNLENLMKQNSPEALNVTDIMARSMAIGDLCMKATGIEAPADDPSVSEDHPHDDSTHDHSTHDH